jgi:endothelin-converting enzyme/putative endopeptidase
VVVNMPEFAQAFSCKPGQPMAKELEKVCRVWQGLYAGPAPTA